MIGFERFEFGRLLSSDSCIQVVSLQFRGGRLSKHIGLRLYNKFCFVRSSQLRGSSTLVVLSGVQCMNHHKRLDLDTSCTILKS